MAFHNVQFPLDLAALQASPTWPVRVIEMGGGAEQRVIMQADSLRTYNAATAITTIEAYRSVVEHFNGRRGMGYSFPLKDRTLYKLTTPKAFGTGGGAGSTNQLSFDEGDSGNSYIREVYLPIAGTIHIFANAVEKIEGTHWSLAYNGSTGGTVTWITSVSGQTLTWTGQFLIPVRYDTESLPGAEVFAMLDDANGVGLVQGVNIPLREVRYPSEWV